MSAAKCKGSTIEIKDFTLRAAKCRGPAVSPRIVARTFTSMPGRGGRGGRGRGRVQGQGQGSGPRGQGAEHREEVKS